jgi:hypothetical protein
MCLEMFFLSSGVFIEYKTPLVAAGFNQCLLHFCCRGLMMKREL